MAEQELAKWIEAAVSDVLSVAQIPGASTAGKLAGTAIGRVLATRLTNARDVLLGELRQGKLVYLSDVMSEDDAAAFLLRYLRAAQEGAARLNLRLMARVVVGKAHIGEPLYADEFLRYADSLASLKREEVVFLGRVLFWHQQLAVAGDDERNGTAQWDKVKKDLLGEGRLFRREADMQATALAVSRTGLLWTGSTWDGATYRAATALVHLGRLLDFEDVLRAEATAT